MTGMATVPGMALVFLLAVCGVGCAVSGCIVARLSVRRLGSASVGLCVVVHRGRSFSRNKVERLRGA
ncbi:hypothetical protein A2J01_31050 [Rhodococcus sp. EPR-134]|nr:hypothetical protein A2J01_31050 [Rhodococcus sp. EPR-134]